MKKWRGSILYADICYVQRSEAEAERERWRQAAMRLKAAVRTMQDWRARQAAADEITVPVLQRRLIEARAERARLQGRVAEGAFALQDAQAGQERLASRVAELERALLAAARALEEDAAVLRLRIARGEAPGPADLVNPTGAAENARRALSGTSGGKGAGTLLQALAIAQEDDEPLTEEDLEAIREAREQVARDEVCTWEEVRGREPTPQIVDPCRGVTDAEVAELEGALRQARHELSTLHGLIATDRIGAYGEALSEGLDHSAAWDSLAETLQTIDTADTVRRIDRALSGTSGGEPTPQTVDMLRDVTEAMNRPTSGRW